jgi:superfamily II RNA helicase
MAAPISYLRVINPSEPCTDMPSELAYEYKFPLDPFQQHAVAAISRSENVLVTAKTGSGKTLVGEYQIAHSLKTGKRVFYTTPIKSLSNQKFYDLKQMFPDRVGIMTGDIKFKPDADIVIMTTEILRNLLYKRGTKTESIGITASLSLDRLGAVVFDECHYINDRDRGSVWEETMILLPPTINLVMLSATIDAPSEFASWLGHLKQVPINLISTEYRIVPLLHGVHRGEELLTVMDNKERFEGGNYKAWQLWQKAQERNADQHKADVANRRRGGYEDGPVQRKTSVKAFPHQLNELIGRLDEKVLLPALFFVFSRKDCERYAKLVEHTLISSSDTASVRHIIDFHLHRYEGLQLLPQYHTLRSLLEKGIAFHHSGVLPVLKEIVEILFGKGFIKVLFATETFAVGINMPTKTVVFTGYRKYDDAVQGMRVLNTDEYIQMAGRAGRRGKDTSGLVLYLPDRDPEELEDVRRMMTGKKSTFQSRMSFYYDFLLKTFQTKTLRWNDLMLDSYWFKRQAQLIVACKREMETVSKQLEAVSLTPTEIDAMLEFEAINQRIKDTTNAPRRQAQRDLEAWRQKRIGPRWHKVEKELWPASKRLGAEQRFLVLELEALQAPERDVEPTLNTLRHLGFLDREELTPLGTLASEINEGHCLLEPMFYEGETIKGLKTAEEILTVLAVFLGEGAGTATVPNVPATVVASIEEIMQMAAHCRKIEDGNLVQVPLGKSEFWDVNTEWVEPIWRWLQGAELSEIIADYGVFEGNFIRILSKLVNVLEEWRALATLKTDTDMLNLLSEVEQKLRTNSNESLYLRL